MQYLVSYCLYYVLKDKTSENSAIRGTYLNAYFWHFLTLAPLLNCAPVVADLFLFCYERDFMMSLSDDKQVDNVDAFNTTSRYLDDISNIDNVFDNVVSQLYPSELQLNKAYTSDTEACICQFLMIMFLPKFMINVTILTLKLSISNFGW